MRRYVESCDLTPADARAVFERTISKVTADEARPLWDRWARYESQFGDLAAIHKLDARISEAYPEAKSIFRFAERHVYLGLTQMIVKDLGMGVSVRARSPTRSPSPDGGRRKRGGSPDGAPRGRVSRFDTGATPPGAKRRRNASPSPQRRFVPPPREVVPPPPMRRPVSPPRRSTPPLMDDPLDGARALLEILPSAQSFNGAWANAELELTLQARSSRRQRSWICSRRIRYPRRGRGWTSEAADALGPAVGVDGDSLHVHIFRGHDQLSIEHVNELLPLLVVCMRTCAALTSRTGGLSMCIACGSHQHARAPRSLERGSGGDAVGAEADPDEVYIAERRLTPCPSAEAARRAPATASRATPTRCRAPTRSSIPPPAAPTA